MNTLEGQTLSTGDVPTAQQIINQITGLRPEDQLKKLNELAVLYNVDLKKIMGVNVAFDISDNTDDIEPQLMFKTNQDGPDSSGLRLQSHLSGGMATNNRYSQNEIGSGIMSPLQRSPGDPSLPTLQNVQLDRTQEVQSNLLNRQLNPSVARKNLSIVVPDNRDDPQGPSGAGSVANRTLEKQKLDMMKAQFQA